MVKCSFCKKEIEKGTGIIFVYANGKVLNFCSRKCEKNMLKLGRKARNVKWASKEKKK
ncbi:MAG: 50S ribosomal protein L24e [Nanoarchaeota archaeon]|nr:50S ribosomal protein L24e [Nanoarchaeota archaeon]